MIDLTTLELNNPTAYERMTPKERVTALRDFRNFGTEERPIFSSDFKCQEDYVAANEQYNREHPDKASFAPKGSAYAHPQHLISMKIDGRKLRAMERERQMIARAEAERRVIERLIKEAGMTPLQAIGALEDAYRRRRAKAWRKLLL